jgi:hypothetical protein
MEEFLLDELEGSITESEDEFDIRLCQEETWEGNVCEESQELDVPNDKEWWKCRVRRF